VDDREIPDWWLADFPAFSITTEVLAVDDHAAIELAGRRFSDALAILQLGDVRGKPVLGRSVILVSDRGDMSYNPDPVPSLRADQAFDAHGNLGPVEGALSQAAYKSLAEQTDWERRCLAAARWLTNGVSSAWSADAVLSLTVALETLFVKDRSVANKGQAIADGVSTRWTVEGLSQEAQHEWLVNVYRKRNDAVHEGRDLPVDLDVGRLTFLTWIATRWAGEHLLPEHREGGPCRTFDEAHADHPGPRT